MHENGRKPIDITKVADPFTGESVKLPNGKTSRVRQPTGKVMRTIEAANRTDDQGRPVGSVTELFAAVAWCLPDVTEADVDEMTADQMLAVLNIASGKANEVMQAIKDEAPPTGDETPGDPPPPAG